MSFSNPFGFIALLGIPAILLIHFFQRRSQPVYVSTLFLLDRGTRESLQGRRIDRLVQSIPMWMQLLLVLLLTFLLVKPVVFEKKLTQRVAIVVDSSASMRVFEDAAKIKLESILSDYKGSAEHLELFLLDSDAYESPLYHGDSDDELMLSLKEWEPIKAAHSSVYSLKMARSLVGADGEVVFITDVMPDKTVADSHVYSVGEDIANCGFTGIQFQEEGEQLYWQVSVRNYSASVQERSWVLIADGKKITNPKVIELGPNRVLTLRGQFPVGARMCELRLNEDDFTLDDRLPFVRPVQKMLKLQSATPNMDLIQKLIESFDGVESTEDVDIWVVAAHSLSQVDDACMASIIASDYTGQYLTGELVSEPHALMDGVNWQSLLVGECRGADLLDSDAVLLWQGEKPLILLRQKEAPQLIFNFDLARSNAFKQEAFAVLLWRYIEEVRSQTSAFHAGIVDLGQKITIASKEEQQPIQVERIESNDETVALIQSTEAHSVYAPMEPSFFRIKQGSFVHFLGAACFADTREADFGRCSTQERMVEQSAIAEFQQSESERMWRYVLLLCFIAFGVSWFQKGKLP
ncbi:vWA domain-containing protein [Rubritalea sp.]|uniref:vWA domain-containing protein n=1 Tax=Rubritalea sp. TaxID=2109375 RepID=UPI003EF62F9D